MEEGMCKIVTLFLRRNLSAPRKMYLTPQVMALLKTENREQNRAWWCVTKISKIIAQENASGTNIERPQRGLI